MLTPIILKVRRRLRTSPGRGAVRRGKKEGTCAGAALAAPSVPDDGPDEQYPVRDLDAIWGGPTPFIAPKRARKPSRVLIFVSTITWRSYRLLRSPIPEISRSFGMHNRRKIRWTKNLQALYVFWRSVCVFHSTLSDHCFAITKTYVIGKNKGSNDFVGWIFLAFLYLLPRS